MKKCNLLVVALLIVVIACFCIGCGAKNNDKNGSNPDTRTIESTIHDGVTR